jgi:hypothetical protein
MRNGYEMLVEKSEGKGPLERFWSKWEGNIKTDLKYVVCEGVDLIRCLRTETS